METNLPAELLDSEEGAGTSAESSSSSSNNNQEGNGILHLGNTVMGIRAAKGLEFSDVMILDFFSGVSKEDAKAWKVLFAEGSDVHVQDQQFRFPQLEPQLKMLYTAITRSMNRLLFVESTHSEAGEAFFRWLARHSLADKFDLTTARNNKESRYITSDEWKVRGIQFSGQVDTRMQRDALQANVELLDEAIRCFANAGDTSLKSVAVAQKRMQLALLELLTPTSATAATTTAGERLDFDSARVEACRAAMLLGVDKGLFDELQLLCEFLRGSLEPVYLQELFDQQVCTLFKSSGSSDNMLGF
jgi:hypothetical protein